MDSEKVKIIFGLKLRQLRHEKGYSLVELAEKAGISISYINEIEKGKKYPKAEKIMTLAKALNTDYDSLVSLKLIKQLEPIADILNSNILTDLPLDMFGILPTDFVDLMAQNPAKISAFINTIREISRIYGLTIEDFYEAVLRSYQEMNDNYFPDLEAKAQQFRDENNISKTQSIDLEVLKGILRTKYEIDIVDLPNVENEELANINCYFVSARKKLFLNSNLDKNVQTNCLAMEIGFQYLQLKDRPFSNPIVKVNSFDELHNNYKAAYFAGALLINKQIIEDRLTYFIASPKWSSETLIGILRLFNVPTDVFMRRLTNILSGSFQLNNLFLLGVQKDIKSNKFLTTNEMHLRRLHSPHGYARNEHYCRRWLGLHIFRNFKHNNSTNQTVTEVFCEAQISEFNDSKSKYFVITMASAIHENVFKSDTIGFVFDNNLKANVDFVTDQNIPVKIVNQTCERCSIENCAERVVDATAYKKQVSTKNLQMSLNKLK